MQPKVYHRISPPVSILSRMNPIHTLTPYFFQVIFNIILPSTHKFSKWPLLFAFSDKYFVRISHFAHVCYTARPTHSPCLINFITFRDEYNYEAPHNTLFSGLLLLSPSYVWIFSSPPCFQRPPISFLPSCQKTIEISPIKQRVKLIYVFLHLNL